MKRIPFLVILVGSLITATRAADFAGLSGLEVEDGYRAFLNAMPFQLEIQILQSDARPQAT